MIKIRKVNKSDFREYHKLKVAELIEYAKIVKTKIDIPSRNALKKEFGGFLSKNGLFLVIEDNNGLAGYGNGMIYKSPYDSKFHIWYLFVDKEHRRMGLGRKIIQEMTKFAKSKKVNKVVLDVNPVNKPALNLYKNLGFSVNKYKMVRKL